MTDELSFEHLDLDEDPVEEILESFYRPGAYQRGEALCIKILEELDPEYEPAKLYLLLNMAAQGIEAEALELLDELADHSLFEALRLLAFGEGNETEILIYDDLIACAQARGLEEQLRTFFDTPAQPQPEAENWLQE